MGLPIHTVEVLPGSNPPAQPDRVAVALLTAVATAAGSGAGAAVTTAITGLALPATYSVQVTPNQDAVAYVTSKSQSGFSVVLNPRLAANTLAAGTVDITIFA
ncbi:hypothetical protein EFP18_12150 [Burkholderia glumae]|uniref:hypothetical protein n=1 Tax=Burkholderia TaxID=32008 RepID=UPI001641B564|nr:MULTISPECIES: hypothetical protein [Burkholderia]MBJ9663185.1 hypothetical protein [Burkholderia gladioli]MCM2537979.1 hypothetical protein [Burkholderia glumae]MCM2547632.1 hypothetical protein [Burkholderia glumae]MCQ0030379.1 hypothetical protein [Burkholderia glumae]MCQ0035704.1 hypothetical protein [Burkholderia glumae]